ncbi:phist protein [Plasmodium malariae]|uniref:Phist protein n=1 Tax=Plasmodium malariae TaxID=5858 RepID=A0A1A8X8Y2_PLAMA|nr:phist protein [Plasmodium malariae]
MNLCNKRNLRNLSELILKKIEKFIEFNDQRLLEVTRDMRVPKTSGTVDEDEKTKFMMRQYERGNISYCNNCGNCNNCSNSRNSKNVDNSCEDKDNKRIDEEEK